MPTSEQNDPVAVERRFFTSLVEANVMALDEILTDDFLMIDVLSGQEVAKAFLLDAIRSGQLIFERIEPIDAQVRHYGPAAIVTGHTQMNGRYGESAFAAHSRYTHVYVQDDEQWKMASAQGTRIIDG